LKQSNINDYHRFGDLDWQGCYAESRFNHFTTEESTIHPAKASMALMERIFEHLESYGFISKSSVIIDPMAGSGRTNIMASLRGYESVAVELEEKFVDLIKGNIKLFEEVVGRPSKIKVIKGDAREVENLFSGDVGITSPPYAEAIANKRRAETGGIAKREMEKGNLNHFSITMDGYSKNKENIGNLKDRAMLVSAITSPPYGFDASGTGITSKNNKTYDENNPNYAMKGYDGGKNNIGGYSNQTYQEAMLQVYKGLFDAKISPVVTITKNPTKNKKLKRLDTETIDLLEAAGYEIADYHRAILWEEVEQQTLDGDNFKEFSGRLSFFKRLSLEQGNVAAKWEDIIIAKRSE
tara:strand:+ start:2632 stop:3687 length:1056 start_codon:yes stop_codon:yes gene_type:complete